ncbi:28S ribosomal protein S21, mitochondrial-like [Mya arenaria]|uniref:28S ribosomal protein S21, mitochondrial-like n=1 Tax=Mya arenaria TaxID=6604 RepID=UPI0022E147B1|nr:28S ribosomal protein S21, mitochondrial-like [Mya arenaria]
MVLARSARFLTRTVLVKNNDIDKSYNLLQGALNNDGVMKEERDRRRFIRPTEMRKQLSYDRCKRIYNSEMNRKLKFLMCKNRVDPCPR